jgi:hypothetical protein
MAKIQLLTLKLSGCKKTQKAIRGSVQTLGVSKNGQRANPLLRVERWKVLKEFVKLHELLSRGKDRNS